MKGFASLCLLMISISGMQHYPVSNDSAAGSELEAVLSQMDASAAVLKTAKADFELRNYPKAPDEINTRKGRVYFRRTGSSVEAMVRITSPVLLQIHFADGKLSTYEEAIDQVTKHQIAEHGPEVEAFLNLGFGAGGHDLLKNYQVQMTGWEVVDAVKTAKLDLVPGSPKVRSMFSHFVLWIDPQRDMPMRVQGVEPSGDYWLLQCRNSKLNSKLSDDLFRFKATSHTGYFYPE